VVLKLDLVPSVDVQHTRSMESAIYMVGGSTGPRTEAGLASLTQARTKHGKFIKEKRAAARRFAEQERHMRGELKELEAWFVENGHLDKNWRDQFKITD